MRCWRRALSLTGLLLALQGGLAAAGQPEDAVRETARTRQPITVLRDGVELQTLFIDAVEACSYVAVLGAPKSIANFSVCRDQVRERATPPPAWIDQPATREFLQRVVELARVYGSSSGLDGNGYKIYAGLRSAAGVACQRFEVLISLDHALVQRDLVENCH